MLLFKLPTSLNEIVEWFALYILLWVMLVLGFLIPYAMLRGVWFLLNAIG